MSSLITGGAGFIGINLADRILSKGKKRLIIVDDLSRSGAKKNLDWLTEKHGENAFDFFKLDISRDQAQLEEAITGAKEIYHLAAQVAVTTSVTDPHRDFEINALGTLHVLEAMKRKAPKAKFLYSSTNKVYGEMRDLEVVEDTTRYKYRDMEAGVSETQQLDFHSPYGCSKGSGDSYVLDYARVFGLNTVVLRQSCIYGTRQFGMEDQGWVAWFIIAVLTGIPIKIYGDGKQVRDVLYIDDLLDAYEKAFENIADVKGHAFNIGGGPKNTMSIWKEFGPMLEDVAQKKIKVTYSKWRPGDQKVYISDVSKAQKALGWKPKTSPEKGVEKVYKWAMENSHLFAK